jgi:PPOX class probable F420-dependent enzyme
VAYTPKRMSSEEIDAFLAAPRHALVAVEGEDGAPLLSPVWYAYEGGRLYISCFSNSAKARALRRNPRIAICVDGAHPDARFVSLYGRATLLDGDGPELEALRWRITRRYCASEEEARRDFDDVPQSDCATIVLEPEKIVARDYNDDTPAEAAD